MLPTQAPVGSTNQIFGATSARIKKKLGRKMSFFCGVTAGKKIIRKMEQKEIFICTGASITEKQKECFEAVCPQPADFGINSTLHSTAFIQRAHLQ